jgi:transposase
LFLEVKSEIRIPPDSFTVSFRSNVQETTGTLVETQLVSSPQQHSCLHGALHPDISHDKTPVVPQPPYSPDLSPVDILLFPELKIS